MNISYIAINRIIEEQLETDKKYRSTQLVYNWVQDLELELGNAGMDDRKFYNERISL